VKNGLNIFSFNRRNTNPVIANPDLDAIAGASGYRRTVDWKPALPTVPLRVVAP
jgi:hypothetical protein